MAQRIARRADQCQTTNPNTQGGNFGFSLVADLLGRKRAIRTCQLRSMWCPVFDDGSNGTFHLGQISQYVTMYAARLHTGNAPTY